MQFDAILESLSDDLPAVRERLDAFSQVPRSLWPRELLFCIFTPQSSPFHAEHAVAALEELGIFSSSPPSLNQITEVLANPTHYVRFHRVKGARVLRFLEVLPHTIEILIAGLSPFEERERLVRLIDGYGWKEASHALRNIGRRNLAILDRHILRNLHRLGVLHSMPRTLSERHYKDVELRFLDFAASLDLTIDELDLLFWKRETGKLFK